MAKFIVQFYDEDGRQILGSDGSAIMDLKTVGGVLRRLKDYRITPRARRFEIYRTIGNFYDESKHRFETGGSIEELRTLSAWRRSTR